MACGYLPGLQGVEYFRCQCEEAQGVGNGGAVFAHVFCYLFLCEKTLVYEHAIGFGFFNGIEIFSLNILNQREFHHFLVCTHIHNNCRHNCEFGLTRGAKTTLACDQLIARSKATHRNRLNDTFFAD